MITTGAHCKDTFCSDLTATVEHVRDALCTCICLLGRRCRRRGMGHGCDCDRMVGRGGSWGCARCARRAQLRKC